MKRLIKNTILLTVLIASPTILFGHEVIKTTKNLKWTEDNTDFEHPEKMYKEYYNVDRDIMPQDFLGDWSIPEREVATYAGVNHAWNGDNIDWVDYVTKPLFAVEESYFESGNSSQYQEMTYWHEKYKNWFGFIPDERGKYWTGDSWEDFDDKESTFDNSYVDNAIVTERTPMRGIIPFWEYTSQFNNYVMTVTNNGSTLSDDLYYEDAYAPYINDYINSTESTYPVIYRYLEDPSLLYDIFITNDDSVEWILPEDYQLVKYDDLTSAFVGIDGNWKVSGFMQYLFDFVIWNWNTNVYPNKTDIAYYDTLMEITPYDIAVEAATDKSEYGRLSVDGSGITSSDDEFETLWKDVSIGEYGFVSIGISNQGVNGDGSDASWIDDIAKYYQYVGLSFLTSEGSVWYADTSPKYRWEATNHVFTIYDGREDNFEMFNPMNQQMNVNVTPTVISFDGLTTRYEEDLNLIKESEIDEDNKLYIESTVSEFKTIFEDWLINSETGINKYFVDFYSDCHINDYYNNYEGDGTAFIGHNRFQSGIYPVEDLRLNDLIITYTDQDGNVLSDDVELGSIKSINMSIEYNEESDNAKLFDATSASPTSLSFDTSSLESRDPITPDNNDEGVSILLILIIALLVISVVGAIIAVLVIKNKK